MSAPRPDRYGRDWSELPDSELCDECGQPDNCGDCNHEPYTDDEVRRLRGGDPVTKDRGDLTPQDMAEASAVPGRWVARTRLDAVAELLRKIVAEADYLTEADGSSGDVVGAWAREALAMLDTAPPPAHLPSSAWMEAVARAAASYVAENGARAAQEVHLAGRHGDPGDRIAVVNAAVEHALRTPPPSGPGGPNG